MTSQEFDAQFEAANRRGLEMQVGTVHAVSARYNALDGMLELELRGGMKLLIPAHLLQGVADQNAESIARVELSACGSALHWPALDADFSIQSLAAGSFGSASWMQKLEEEGRLDEASLTRRRALEKLQTPTASSMGRKGGAARSETKAASSRANGAKGGRPRKSVLS